MLKKNVISCISLRSMIIFGTADWANMHVTWQLYASSKFNAVFHFYPSVWILASYTPSSPSPYKLPRGEDETLTEPVRYWHPSDLNHSQA